MTKLKLVLHIGVHRTATSSLQTFLRTNWTALQRQGILYPYGVKRHFALVNALFSGRTTAQEAAQELIGRATSKTPIPHTILLSDEDISMRADLTALAALKEHFDVHVIYALRRQDRWLESWYLQNIKWQWDPILSHLTFEEFLNQIGLFHWIDYDRYVTMLEQTFGADHVKIFAFDRPQMPDGPIAKFAEVAGFDISRMQLTPAQNQSLMPMVSEFARCLPLDQAPDKFRNKLTDALFAVEAALTAGQPGGSDLLMDHATRTRIMADYAEGNARLARRHLGQDALFLEPMPAPDRPIAERSLPADSYAVIEQFMAPFVLDLIRQHKAEVAAAAADGKPGVRPTGARAGGKAGVKPKRAGPKPQDQSPEA